MAFIKQDCIETILDIARIEEVIGDFIELKKAGVNYRGLSPFSKERTPSFMVSPVKQIWKDFSTGKGGTVVSFLMEKQMSFTEAIKYIGNKYNKALEYEDPAYAEKAKELQDKKEIQRETLSYAFLKYKQAFKSLPENHKGYIEIFGKRQYTSEIVNDWGIGFAPGDRYIYDVLKEKGKVEDGKALGVLSFNGPFDKLKDRIIYPIHDDNGLLVGFAGRDISGSKEAAKWINPPVSEQNLLYNKSAFWFGMNRARTEIKRNNKAWIVEGYNDVIAFQENGLTNTIASCGTAITDQQINRLRKICETVVFAMDPDAAGMRAVLKHIPVFIAKGFRTEVLELPCDPDDFSREYKKSIEKYTLPVLLQEKDVLRDGFSLLIEHHIKGTEIDKSMGARILVNMIASIEDESIAEIYLKWVIKESGVSKATVNRWVKEHKAHLEEVQEYNEEYQLPKEVKIPFSELEKDIKHYGMFMANNKIFMAAGQTTDGKVHFMAVSNFMIEILQHMNNEKFPMKLIRIKNTDGIEKIFDTQSENLNTPQAFDNTVTSHGNFRFDGNRGQLLTLRRFLFDKMGNGEKIEILGWQPDGKFWAWNNGVLLNSGEELTIDDNGVFVHNKTHYYIPSSNSIYRNNSFKFEAQKRFRIIRSEVNINLFFEQCMRVHREHFISALLFSMTCLFRDIIVQKLNRFPILFLYGPGGTGKDELAEIVQGFLGLPQTAINLEAELSTGKASIRELAQFRNGISQLSEYKRGNKNIDGMLKQIYDCRGYKRGNIESFVGVDSIPVESGVVLTGNDYPDSEPLIQRMIWNEMTKNIFTDQEIKEFDKLKDMMYQGISGYSNEILKHRSVVEEKFEKKQRSWKSILKDRFPEAKERMIANLSIISSIYEIFRDDVQIFKFPFSQTDMMQHYERGIEQQIRRINSYSIIVRFWDCFVSSMRGPNDDRIQARRIVNIEGDRLFVQWTHSYAKIQKQWWVLWKEAPPKKEAIIEEIKKQPGLYMESLSKYSFDSGREAVRTSAVVMSLQALPEALQEDIKGSFLFQLNESTLFDGENPFSSNSPATPSEEKIIKEDGEFPF
jgi:DNA primase catalytic core